MAIIKGSTPTIRIVIGTDEVAWNTLDKVYLTFAQKDSIITGLNTTFTKGASSPNPAPVLSDDGKTFVCEKKLTQTETLAFIEDIDLDCQVDVLTTGDDRKISKIFSFGICKSLRNSVLTGS